MTTLRDELEESIETFEVALAAFLKIQNWKGKFTREVLEALEQPILSSSTRLRTSFASSRSARLREPVPSMREDNPNG